MVSFDSWPPGDLCLIGRRAYNPRAHTDTLLPHRLQSDHPLPASIQILWTAWGTDHASLVWDLFLASVVICLHGPNFHLQTFSLKKFYFASLPLQFWTHVSTTKRLQELVKGCKSFCHFCALMHRRSEGARGWVQLQPHHLSLVFPVQVSSSHCSHITGTGGWFEMGAVGSQGGNLGHLK